MQLVSLLAQKMPLRQNARPFILDKDFAIDFNESHVYM